MRVGKPGNTAGGAWGLLRVLACFSYGNWCRRNTKASKKMGERPWERGQSWGWVSCKCHGEKVQEEQKDALYGGRGGRRGGVSGAIKPL